MNIHGRLFQAKMWREYAQEWDGPCPAWVRDILQISRQECLRRARVNLYLAKRLNRTIRTATP